MKMKKISDLKEIQFRQVNPNWIEEDGKPSRLAFIPTKKDEWKLSLDRSASLTAKQSYENFRAQGFKSEGVYGITPEECQEKPNPIECFASPFENNRHHSHADFSELTNTQRKTKSLELRRKAIGRGKQYP